MQKNMVYYSENQGAKYATKALLGQGAGGALLVSFHHIDSLLHHEIPWSTTFGSWSPHTSQQQNALSTPHHHSHKDCRGGGEQEGVCCRRTSGHPLCTICWRWATAHGKPTGCVCEKSVPRGRNCPMLPVLKALSLGQLRPQRRNLGLLLPVMAACCCCCRRVLFLRAVAVVGGAAIAAALYRSSNSGTSTSNNGSNSSSILIKTEYWDRAGGGGNNSYE